MYPLELQLVGKLGNYVHYYIGSKHFVRAYCIPVQPGTNPQKARWNLFSKGVKDWQKLTTAEKAVWNANAVPLKMSGFNLFMRVQLT